MNEKQIMKIRSETLLFKSTQDTHDDEKLQDVDNRLRHCRSLLDLIDCKRIPALESTKDHIDSSKNSRTSATKGRLKAVSGKIYKDCLSEYPLLY